LEEIYGIGHVHANDLIKKYKIKNVENFIKLVNDGKIKISENIKKGLFYHDKIKINIPRENIINIKENITKSLKIFNDIKFKICGSYRRKLKYCNDIDLLIACKDIKSNLLYDIINILKKDDIIYDDYTIVNIHTKYSGICKYLKELYRIDIILLPYKSYYSGLLYFTGSKEFNINIRKTAKKLGYKLNEYGLYKNDI
jgi:DNA polymerase/3'-5' exonuclease PolX